VLLRLRFPAPWDGEFGDDMVGRQELRCSRCREEEQMDGGKGHAMWARSGCESR
jgi:hypothetical protein